VNPVLTASQWLLAALMILAAGLLGVWAVKPISRGVIPLFASQRGARNLALAAALCLALLAVVLVIAIGILTRGSIVQADAMLASFLFAHRTPWLDQGMMLVSALGDGPERTAGTIVVAGYLLWRRRRREAVGLAVVMIAAALLVPALKTTFHFARPSLLYSGADAFSFPSGHATSAVAFYSVLAWIVARSQSRPWRVAPWALAALMILLTGLSRIYLGAHWFSDVLAGFALGGALGVIGVCLVYGPKADVATVDGGRDGAMILAILLTIGAVLGPGALRKAHRLYAPYLQRTLERVVDPGHLAEPGDRPVVSPPGV